MASRNLDDLVPELKEKALKFLEEAKKNGIDVLIYCTYRSPEEQELLYKQGRLRQFGLTVEKLNEERKKLGLYPLTNLEANRIVTHARGGQSKHNHRKAFDCVPLVAGKASWDNKILYQKLGEIGTKLGLKWGGNWQRFKEFPHFEID